MTQSIVDAVYVNGQRVPVRIYDWGYELDLSHLPPLREGETLRIEKAVTWMPDPCQPGVNPATDKTKPI